MLGLSREERLCAGGRGVGSRARYGRHGACGVRRGAADDPFRSIRCRVESRQHRQGLRGAAHRRATARTGRAPRARLGGLQQHPRDRRTRPRLIDLHSRQLSAGRAGESGRAPLARLLLRHGAVGTSGTGEQFVEIDGRRYGHLLDPRTGWPAASGLLSASVVTRDAATADALATAFFVGGFGLADQYCATHPDTLALLTPDDGSERPRIFGRYPGAQVEDV